MRQQLSTAQALLLHRISEAATTLSEALHALRVNDLPEQNRRGLVNTLDHFHDQIHLIKQATNITPNPHAS